MADQMTIPNSLGFGGARFPVGFSVAVARVSGGGFSFSRPAAEVAPVSTSVAFSEMPFALDALFLQPEFVTRAVYFSQVPGGGGNRPGEFDDVVDDGDDGDDDANSENAQDEAVSDLHQAFARADSVMDALVMFQDGFSSPGSNRGGGESSEEHAEPLVRAGGMRKHPEKTADAVASSFRPNVDGQMSRKRTEKRLSRGDSRFNAKRLLVGFLSLCLVITAATFCAQATLVVADRVCRVLFGEDEEDEDEEHEDSKQTPLLVLYEGKKINNSARDSGDDEALLVEPPPPPRVALATRWRAAVL